MWSHDGTHDGTHVVDHIKISHDMRMFLADYFLISMATLPIWIFRQLPTLHGQIAVFFRRKITVSDVSGSHPMTDPDPYAIYGLPFTINKKTRFLDPHQSTVHTDPSWLIHQPIRFCHVQYKVVPPPSYKSVSRDEPMATFHHVFFASERSALLSPPPLRPTRRCQMSRPGEIQYAEFLEGKTAMETG